MKVKLCAFSRKCHDSSQHNKFQLVNHLQWTLCHKVCWNLQSSRKVKTQTNSQVKRFWSKKTLLLKIRFLRKLLFKKQTKRINKQSQKLKRFNLSKMIQKHWRLKREILMIKLTFSTLKFSLFLNKRHLFQMYLYLGIKKQRLQKYRQSQHIWHTLRNWKNNK